MTIAHLADACRLRTLQLLGGSFPQRVDGTLGTNTLIYGLTYSQWQAYLALTEEIAAAASHLFLAKL